MWNKSVHFRYTFCKTYYEKPKENSAKYRRLFAQVDSLNAISARQNQELESVYADFIDVDTRDFDAIELNEKKSKILFFHPAATFQTFRSRRFYCARPPCLAVDGR